jgi:hypothetical protein
LDGTRHVLVAGEGASALRFRLAQSNNAYTPCFDMAAQSQWFNMRVTIDIAAVARQRQGVFRLPF